MLSSMEALPGVYAAHTIHTCTTPIRYKHAYTTLLCTCKVPYATRELAVQIELAPTETQHTQTNTVINV